MRWFVMVGVVEVVAVVGDVVAVACRGFSRGRGCLSVGVARVASRK
jgi:hypothetical protein